MSDVPDFVAAGEIGERVMDMADRLVPVDKVVPGTVASCSFKLDGIEFDVTLRIKPREQSK